MGFREAIRGIGQALNTLDSLEQEIMDSRGTMALAAAELAADRTRAIAPAGPTGNLKNGIVAKKFREGSGPSQAFVGYDAKIAPHWHFIEYGTYKQKANPILRTTVDHSYGAMESEIAKMLSDIVDKHQKKVP